MTLASMPSRRAVLGGALALAASVGGMSSARSRSRSGLRLRRGMNTWPWFSLTREYPAPRTDYAWPPFQPQRPVPTPADLANLRRAGIDFVRIPVDPGPFIAATKQQRVMLVDSLLDAVDRALDADLSVVVNIQANDATHYWNSRTMIADMAAPGFLAYRELIGEIAARLGRRDPGRVALEPVNEPFQDCAAPAWLDVQMALLTTARAAAPELVLVAAGSCGSMVSGLEALDPAPLSPLEPLFFTFHFYEPYLFSHQGAPWMSEPVYRALNAVPWPASSGSLETTLDAVRARMAQDDETPTAAKRAALRETEKVLKVYFDAQPDRAYIDRFLGAARLWGDRHGIEPHRILMGEFGALRSDARYVAAGAADRARYVRDVRMSAEAFDLPWAFWNLFDGMGVMGGETRKFDPAMLEALGLEARSQ